MTTLASFMSPIGFSNFPWMRFALQEIGEAEIRGPRHNPRILEYQRAGHNKTDEETPWCSAFANWCMTHGGQCGTGLPNARSWLNWGEPLVQPVYGCVSVLSRPPDAWHGHVGFFVGADAGHIWVLGGNQRGATGGEVSIGPYPRSRLLGFRWPTGLPRP
jgi:uncharacterized protein (TIGR02594 family)